MLHLYYKTSISMQISDVVNSFEICQALDISELHEVEKVDVYLVEIQKAEEPMLLHIEKLLSNKKNSLIYFFIDNSKNLMLSQLATLLGVKSIFTAKDETPKIISSIKEDILLKATTMQNKPTKKRSSDSIKNRIYFMEELHNKILERSASKSIYSIVTMDIQNIHSMQKFWSEYEIEMAIGSLLLQIDIDANTLVAQYNSSMYVMLFEGLDFEATKEKATTIQAHLSAYTSKHEIKPIVTLYAVDINEFELNDLLKTLSDISNEALSSKEVETQKIHRIINIDGELDDEKAIDILLQTAYINKTPIKLLNIYKGLFINTDSRIVKKTQDEIYVSFEQLQGTAMDFEKKLFLSVQALLKI